MIVADDAFPLKPYIQKLYSWQRKNIYLTIYLVEPEE